MTQLWGIEEDVLALGVSILALLVSIIAIFREYVVSIFFKPEIEVLWANNEECIQRARMMVPLNNINSTRYDEISADSNWLRLKILNSGKSTTKNCYVKLTAIRNDKGDIIKPFDPSPLKWTVFDEYKIDLAKKENHLVNLVYQREGTSFFYPATINLPNSLKEKIDEKLPSGKFKLDVTVYGDNIEPKSKQIEIHVFKDYKKLIFNIDEEST
jgi:hypothetical protein